VREGVFPDENNVYFPINEEIKDKK